MNKSVFQGCDLTSALVDVLCRFRQESIALVADKESMYYQVRVSPCDVSASKLLWSSEGEIERGPEKYEMLMHLFGGIGCSCVAKYAL